MLDRAFRGYVAVNHGQVLTYETVLMTVRSCIMRRYAGEKHAVKKLATDQDVPEQTAKNWIQGKCLPSSPKLLQMAKTDPALWREICLMTGHVAEGRTLTEREWEGIKHMLEAFSGHLHMPAAASRLPA